MRNRIVKFENLGLSAYKETWEYQETLFEKVVQAKQINRENVNQEPVPNYLLFCEHPHVYTLGKSGKKENLLISEEYLKARGADFYRINRGGDITYHGPGQLVGYPILDLDNFSLSVKSYVNKLEEVIIRTLKSFGITSSRSEGATGVWLDAENPLLARKICAIGVRTSHWVSMHGFAFNISTDLEYFNYIVPCGISDKKVTTLQKELGYDPGMEVVEQKVKEEFEKVFGMILS